MPATLRRTALVAGADEAREIVRALEAVTGIPATWDRFTRRDGSETDGATLALNRSTIEVHVSESALPAVLELVVDDLTTVLERLLNAGLTARTSPNAPDAPLEQATVTVAEVALVAVAAPVTDVDLAERDGYLTCTEATTIEVFEEGK